MKSPSGKMNKKLTIFWLEFHTHKERRRSLSVNNARNISQMSWSVWVLEKVFALNLTLHTSQSTVRWCESLFAKRITREVGRFDNFISVWRLPRKLISLQKDEVQITFFFSLLHIYAACESCEIIANLNAPREKKEKKYKWVVLMALL